MLSLKNFRNLNEDELAFRKVLSIFLDKIATGCVQCDNIERDAFRAEMRQLRKSRRSVKYLLQFFW